MDGLYVAPPPPPGSDFHSAAWQIWLSNLSAALRGGQTISWANIDFTVSNILSIATRLHQDLQGLQGGNTTEQYHLTYAQYIAATTSFTSLASGLTPASGGGTANFLRADGTWAAAGGGGPGSAGPMGMMGLDGQDGDDGMMLPGLQGPAGAPATPGNTAYGELAITNNAVGLVCTLQNVAYQVVSGWVLDDANGFTDGGGRLVAGYGGAYLTCCSVSIGSSSSNQVYNLQIFKNGVAIPSHNSALKLTNSSDINSMTSVGLIDNVMPGDAFTVWLTNVTSAGQTAVISYANFSIAAVQGATGLTGAFGPPGLDGQDGDDGVGMPGPVGLPGLAGSNGTNGTNGLNGVSIMGMDGADGDDGQPIPGARGVNGSNGAAGSQGPQGFALDGDDGQDAMMIPGIQGVAAPALGFAGGLTALVTVASTVTPTTAGRTLLTQVAAVGSVWRIRAHGTFVAATSVTARNAIISAFWGATALPTIAVAVLISTAQTTTWEVEFIITASSATAVWTSGFFHNELASATLRQLSNSTPASTTVTAGAQTLDLRVSSSVVVAGDSWVVQNVTMERMK